MAENLAGVDSFSWSTAFKIALREARSSTAKFLFVVLAVGVGVGVLTGVRGFGEAFRGTLLAEARTLMAGDLLVREWDAASPDQEAILADLVSQGVEMTRITETVSMMSSDQVSTPVLVSVKAVDSQVYPFYGEVILDPPVRLSELLTPDSVAVSDDLIPRLEIGIGDFVRLGEESFRIAGIVRLEPDRMTGSLNVGPRIMMTREGLDRAGLMRVGSRASRRFLFRLPAEGVDVAEVRERLTEAFRGALVTDFREVHPRIRRGLERSTNFLSLVSLIAMIVGALGVAMAMHSHLQQRMDTIGIMKCLGGRSRQIIRIYLLQTAMLGLAGGVLGVLFGMAVQASFPILIERYFQLRPERIYDIASAFQGIAIGLLATLLFTLPPLLGIRDVRPAVIFRREMVDAKRSLRERWMRARASIIVGVVILLVVGLIAAWMAGGDWDDRLETSLVFLGGLVGSLAALSAIAWVLLRLLRTFVRTTKIQLPATLRHGIANIYRPGNHAQALLVALGVGVMFTLTVYLVQNGLLTEMMSSAPKDMPNVFLINITAREHAGLEEMLGRQPGIEGEARIYPSTRARITSIDGTPMSEVPLEGWRDRYRRERTVTSLGEMPPNVKILQGAWWTSNTGTDQQICITEHIAEALNVRPGAKLDWVAGGVELTATLACVHDVEEVRFGPSLDFVFSPGALADMPTTYFGGLRMAAADVGALQRVVYQSYPTVTVINVAEVIAIVQEVVDQVALVIRFVALFAILAGIIILASSVAGTRFRRIREAAILKTLGATRRRVMLIFSIEFLILGAVAGLMGSLLASGFAGILLTRMLDAPFLFDPIPNLAAVVLTALITVVAGWMASFRILGQKPLEVLRNE
jgi:putative ABC transport system permease protein